MTPGLTHPVDIFQDITGVPDSPCLQKMREYCDELIELDINCPCNPALAALKMMYPLIEGQEIDYDSFMRWAGYCEIYSLKYCNDEKANHVRNIRMIIDKICERGEGMIWFTPEGIKGLHYEDPELTRLYKQQEWVKDVVENSFC